MHRALLLTRSVRQRAALGVLAFLFMFMVLPACSTSRLARLERKADRVESRLQAEQKRVLALPISDDARAARLSHLSQLRGTLSAANVARGTVAYVVDEPQRPIAYDVIEEVYATIEWNIPLGPDQPQRALPAQFDGASLSLSPLPSTQPIQERHP